MPLTPSQYGTPQYLVPTFVSLLDFMPQFVRDRVLAGANTSDLSGYIQQAATHAAQTGATLISPPATYWIESGITVLGPCNLSQAIFDVHGNPSVALTVGSDTEIENASILLPQVVNASKAGLGWSGIHCGVKLINLTGCMIYVPKVQNFAPGVHCSGTNANGFVYNTMTVGRLVNNQVNLLMKPESADGWVNQNLVLGGQYAFFTNEGTNVSGCRHIQIMPYDVANDATPWPNNNCFINCSVEGDTPAFHIEIAGNYHMFMAPRFESSPPRVNRVGHASTSGLCTDNQIIGGYATQNVVYSKEGMVARQELIGTRAPFFQGTGDGWRIANPTSDNNASFIVFPNSVVLEDQATTGTTNWIAKFGGVFVRGKRTGDTEERMRLDFNNGRLYLGSGGSTAIADYFDRVTAGFRLTVGGTTQLVSKDSVSADKGDADATLLPASSEYTNVWATPLTQVRTITLSSTSAVNGVGFRVVRTAAATGASALSVGGLKDLAVGQWAEVLYNGSAYVLTAFGSL